MIRLALLKLLELFRVAYGILLGFMGFNRLDMNDPRGRQTRCAYNMHITGLWEGRFPSPRSSNAEFH